MAALVSLVPAVVAAVPAMREKPAGMEFETYFAWIVAGGSVLGVVAALARVCAHFDKTKSKVFDFGAKLMGLWAVGYVLLVTVARLSA